MTHGIGKRPTWTRSIRTGDTGIRIAPVVGQALSPANSRAPLAAPPSQRQFAVVQHLFEREPGLHGQLPETRGEHHFAIVGAQWQKLAGESEQKAGTRTHLPMDHSRLDQLLSLGLKSRELLQVVKRVVL